MLKEKTSDMTKGNILRQIILFSIPLIIGNIFQQLYSMVDTIIVGRTIGMNALAAVGGCGSPVFFIIGFVTGLTGGFAIMVSHRFGAGDMDEMRRSIAMGAMLSAVFAVLLTAVSVLMVKWLLGVMNTPDEIKTDAYEYLTVICLGIPASMLYNYLSSVIRAIGDSKTPLYFLLIAALLNIVLDFVCILNFNMGVMGAAVATVFSQLVSGILCFVYMNKTYAMLRLKKSDWKLSGEFAWYHIRLGIPMAVQTSVIAIGTIIVQTILNDFGAIAVAGYTTASKTESIITQIMVSFGLTLATFVGQNYGAGQLNRIKAGVKVTTVILLAFSVIGAVFIILFGRQLTNIFIDANEKHVEEVVRFSKTCLTITSCFYPLLSCICVFRSAIQGLGNTTIVLVGSAIELLGRLVAALILSVPFGFVGVCFANPIAWFGSATLFIVVYAVNICNLTKKFKTIPEE